MHLLHLKIRGKEISYLVYCACLELSWSQSLIELFFSSSFLFTAFQPLLGSVFEHHFAITQRISLSSESLQCTRTDTETDMKQSSLTFTLSYRTLLCDSTVCNKCQVQYLFTKSSNKYTQLGRHAQDNHLLTRCTLVDSSTLAVYKFASTI